MEAHSLHYLQQSSKWQPSNKYWYQKFICRARLAPHYNWDKPTITHIKKTFECQVRRIYDHNIKAEIVTVYTNDLDCIRFCLDQCMNVKEINTPFDTDHASYLKTSGYHKQRNTLYYGKYHIKITPFINPDMRIAHQGTKRKPVHDISEFLAWCRDAFKDNGYIRMQDYGSIYSWYYCCPFIYTKDEAAVMMLKLTWGHKFKFDIERVFINK